MNLVLAVFRDAVTGRVTPHEEEGGVGVNTEKKTSHRYYLLPPYFTITGFVTDRNLSPEPEVWEVPGTPRSRVPGWLHTPATFHGTRSN